MSKVGIFIGSASDKEKMLSCTKIMEELEVPYTFTVTSAHRTPNRTEQLVRNLEDQGCKVFICAAGLAAHLAGAVAAKTIRPVLGVPLSASELGGIDSLLSTVQMPPGFPVGTLGLDKVGAKNAAWLAAQILALEDNSIAERIRNSRQEMQRSLEEAANKL